MPKNESHAPAVVDVTRKQKLAGPRHGTTTLTSVTRSPKYAVPASGGQMPADRAPVSTKRVTPSPSPVGFNKNGTNVTRN